MAKEEPSGIIQIKISLLDTDPKIYRRILVDENTYLNILHEIIQDAMGWENYHLHQFVKDKIIYGEPDPEGWIVCEDEMNYTIGDLAPKTGAKFLYEYDFGDGWRHEIRREKLSKKITTLSHPICIEGQYACPPEDCGGVYGYYDLLEVISDPKNPRHEETMEWVGEEFDPNFFDLDVVNTRLQSTEY